MSYSMSVSAVSSNAGDMRVQMTSPVELETAVVEVRDGPAVAPSGNTPETDRALMNAQGMVSAMDSLRAYGIGAAAAVRYYLETSRV